MGCKIDCGCHCSESKYRSFALSISWPNPSYGQLFRRLLSRADVHKAPLVAFEIIAGICVSWLAYHGLVGYYVTGEELVDKVRYTNCVDAMRPHMVDRIVSCKPTHLLPSVDVANILFKSWHKGQSSKTGKNTAESEITAHGARGTTERD